MFEAGVNLSIMKVLYACTEQSNVYVYIIYVCVCVCVSYWCACVC